MKHFRTPGYISPTQPICWLSIIYAMLYKQLKLIHHIKNSYFYEDTEGKKHKFAKTKKELNRMESILTLLKTSYLSERGDYLDRFDKTIDYEYSFGVYSISYYNDFVKKIDYLIERNSQEMIDLKNVYQDRYVESNSNTNIRLQVFALILTIFTISQTIYQCTNGRTTEKKLKRNEYVMPNTYKALEVKYKIKGNEVSGLP